MAVAALRAGAATATAVDIDPLCPRRRGRAGRRPGPGVLPRGVLHRAAHRPGARAASAGVGLRQRGRHLPPQPTRRDHPRHDRVSAYQTRTTRTGPNRSSFR
ncbi:MAG TPA: hypothetical protein VF174_05685 [Micromonosporaceae bacterium]